LQQKISEEKRIELIDSILEVPIYFILFFA